MHWKLFYCVMSLLFPSSLSMSISPDIHSFATICEDNKFFKILTYSMDRKQQNEKYLFHKNWQNHLFSNKVMYSVLKNAFILCGM